MRINNHPISFLFNSEWNKFTDNEFFTKVFFIYFDKNKYQVLLAKKGLILKCDLHWINWCGLESTIVKFLCKFLDNKPTTKVLILGFTW